MNNGNHNILSIDTTLKISKIIFIIFILFHLGIVIGIMIFEIVPVDYLWGGQLKSKK